MRRSNLCRVDRPLPRLIKTARDAEDVAAEWMRYWGFSDATVTPTGKDAGIDVASTDVVAQVKAQVVPAGRPEVQKLLGVAEAAGKRAVFLALAGFSADAIAWA